MYNVLKVCKKGYHNKYKKTSLYLSYFYPSSLADTKVCISNKRPVMLRDGVRKWRRSKFTFVAWLDVWKSKVYCNLNRRSWWCKNNILPVEGNVRVQVRQDSRALEFSKLLLPSNIFNVKKKKTSVLANCIYLVDL